MTKSELIERISLQQKQLSPKDVELAVKMVIEYMANSLSLGERIEIRGFGSFGNDPRDGYTTRPFVQFGEPRMIGITGDYQL